MTQRKIKIADIDDLRIQIDRLYETLPPQAVARWALQIAKHIMEVASLDETQYPEIEEAISTNQKWQMNLASVYDVRQAGLKIHKIAREQTDEERTCVLRIIGQAVSSGHMKEHAMVASDYAVKFMNLRYPGDLEKVREEREWQLKELTKATQ